MGSTMQFNFHQAQCVALLADASHWDRPKGLAVAIQLQADLVSSEAALVTFLIHMASCPDTQDFMS